MLSALLGNLDRYRVPLEVVFIITASIGAVALVELALRLVKRLRTRAPAP